VNVDLVAVVVAVVGRMVVEDYIDLGVDIVLHGLMYLVRIIVVVLVLDLDLDLEIRRLLVISVFLPILWKEGTYRQNHIPPFASTHSSSHQS